MYLSSSIQYLLQLWFYQALEIIHSYYIPHQLLVFLCSADKLNAPMIAKKKINKTTFQIPGLGKKFHTFTKYKTPFLYIAVVGCTGYEGSLIVFGNPESNLNP
jgi:hypothetical protein